VSGNERKEGNNYAALTARPLSEWIFSEIAILGASLARIFDSRFYGAKL
jgi:hypothetical protein